MPFHKGDYHDALRHKAQPGRAALSRVLREHSLRRGPPLQLPRQARLGQETRPRRHQVQQVPPARIYLSHHLAAISMAAVYTVYTDAVHIADGVVGLKQRSLAAGDPAACASNGAHPRRLIHPARLRRSSSVGVCVCDLSHSRVCACACVAFAISLECRSVCVALVAGAGSSLYICM